MRSGGGAMSLLFNNLFVISVFPTPLPQEMSIGKVRHPFSIIVSM